VGVVVAPRSRRWPWVVVAAAVVLASAAGGYWVMTGDDDTAGTVASDRSHASDEDSSVTEEPSPTAAAPSTAGEATSSAAAPSTASVSPAAAATCWDGSTAGSVAECSRPQGTAGLEYVFPSMTRQSCMDRSGIGEAPGRKLLIQCFDTLPDGTQIKLNYSQWGAVNNAVQHYVGKGMAQALGGGYYGFTGLAEDGQVNAAWLYQKEPYSVSVYAPTQSALDEALGTMVQSRPPDSVRGGPTT